MPRCKQCKQTFPSWTVVVEVLDANATDPNVDNLRDATDVEVQVEVEVEVQCPECGEAARTGSDCNNFTVKTEPS